jgi:23S rRNA pseudouridine1911/1915/1917 synthase
MPGRRQTFVVNRSEAGRTIAEFLRVRLRAPSEIERLLKDRCVWVDGRQCVARHWRVAIGQRVRVSIDQGKAPQTRDSRRAATPRLEVRYADSQIVVVEKPAGLTTMRHAEEAAEFGARARRFLPTTLADLLPIVLAQKHPRGTAVVRAVHRLDKDTSGLVAFARSIDAERDLGKQFRAHTVERSYLAVVRGRPVEGRIESRLIADRGDGRRGSSSQPEGGHRAVTHVRVLEQLGRYALVECRLETGRTHQVRIHLAEAGTPLCGERVYDRPVHGQPVPDGSGMKRVALHAATLGFDHPTTRKRMVWKSPLPPDLTNLLSRLRRRKAN